MAIVKQVNERGIQYLREWIAQTSKSDDAGLYQRTTPTALCAWARDIEFQISEGNSPEAEMLAADTISRHTEIFRMPSDGLTDCEIGD